MKTTRARNHTVTSIAAAFLFLFSSGVARAVITVFFSSTQTTNLFISGTTWDTISSEGYLFTVTRDKLFTGGIGLTNPIGRYIRVPWPDGLEVQAVTAGPVTSGAKLTIERQDEQPFAIQSFTAQLLANTAGAGASFEIMPKLNGEDALPDPFMYNATGYAGSRFTYNTPELATFDAYTISLYVDYALMRLTVVDDSAPPPLLECFQVDMGLLQISWPTNAVGYTLEFTTNLVSQTWTRVTNTIATNVDNCIVQIETTGTGRFYRLRK